MAFVRNANLPKRHAVNAIEHDQTKNPKFTKIQKRLEGLAGNGYLIALLGNRGTGKTQLAVNVALHRAIILQQPLYVKTMEYFLAIRRTYSDDTSTELDAIQEFTSPSLLIIDEIGERGDTQFEDRLLVYLLDKRYDAKLDTILIANMIPKVFSKSVGPSIVDRMRETGSIIECNWDSMRLHSHTITSQ